LLSGEKTGRNNLHLTANSTKNPNDRTTKMELAIFDASRENLYELTQRIKNMDGKGGCRGHAEADSVNRLGKGKHCVEDQQEDKYSPQKKKTNQLRSRKEDWFWEAQIDRWQTVSAQYTIGLILHDRTPPLTPWGRGLEEIERNRNLKQSTCVYVLEEGGKRQRYA